MKTYTITEPYLANGHTLGEAPYWDETTNVFRWVDILRGEVHTMDVIQGPPSQKVLSKQKFPIGFTSNIKGRTDAFLVAAQPFIGLMDRTTGKCTPLSETSAQQWTSQGYTNELRFNDGSVDARGRLWIGTMRDPKPGFAPVGSLYRVDPDLSVHRMRKDATIPNGTSWAPGNKTMYWTDTLTQGILQFDYDIETGEMSNERPLIKFDWEQEGGPDGHAMDVEGHLWVAMFGGWSVKRVSPQGKVVAEIRLPTRCVTAPRFVGEDLYITTAQDLEPDKYPESVKQGGNVFKVHVGIRGAPVYDFALAA